MMEQYYEIKKKFPDTFVLFRMGDFYELFFEDAVEVSKILNITLTHRGKIGDTKIPMAGIPHHAATTYVDRITSRGFKAAICEQIEDPKIAQGIVKRAVTQVASPAMPFNIEKTEDSENRFMASGSYQNGFFHLVVIDFTTGQFIGYKLKNKEEFIGKLLLHSPKEIITYMGQWEQFPEIQGFISSRNILKTHLSEEYFNRKFTRIYTEKIIPSFDRDKTIKETEDILSPIGALAYYITSTQHIEEFHHIRPFKLICEKGRLKVTSSTLKGLEILPKNRDDYHNSLLGHLDKTLTAMGARKLKNIFQTPLYDVEKIQKRLNLIQYFLDHSDTLKKSRAFLKEIRDLERIMAKISTLKVTPSDLLNMASSIFHWEEIRKLLDDLSSKTLPRMEKNNWKKLTSLATTIRETINDEIGASLEKGNLIRKGFSKKRDRLSKISENTTGELSKLEAKYRKETGISNLRVKSNNVAGYFIEISKSHLQKVPKYFERKQTLTNSERYITKELYEFEKEIITASEKLEQLEREIFKNLISETSSLSKIIMNLAESISYFDSFAGLAWIALLEDYTKPEIHPKQQLLDIKGGWHPLIKSSIGDKFVPHNLILKEECSFGLITGPNMSGKTTVMREMAIIQIMAQIGSFVPAQKAKLGLCDYIFSRLGANDDITRGQSTFMVEMTETAEIIRHATKNSLIILDEVGRGTSTHDGLSIAWALTEHLAEKTCALTLFATHYHELIEVINKLPHAKNLTVEIINNDGEVHFLYNLIERSASQSFGIYVARLAGIPDTILNRSEQLLIDLEKKEKIKVESTNNQSEIQLSFLETETQTPDYLKNIENDLKKLDILNMTPLRALQKLDEFKQNIPLQ